MKIFTCKDSFDNIMCAVYDAWDAARIYGHDNVQLVREPVIQPNFFDEYIETVYVEEKAQKVIRSITQKISSEALMYVYYASLSDEEDALNAIYRFLRVGFKVGKSVTYRYSDPAVMRIFELKRHVLNELNHFREFVRFNALGDKLYVAHMEPRCNLAFLVARCFEDRMPSEYWMIIDDSRRIAVVHPCNGESYIRLLNEEEYLRLSQTENYSDEYTDMWKTFFNAIAIKQRNNPDCQRNLFPIWLRKHTTEFV